MPAKPPAPQKTVTLSPFTSGLALLPGEMPDEAEGLAVATRARIRPADVIEEVWTDDFVYLTLEVQRLRRMKQRMVEAARPDGLERLLEPIVGASRASTLTTRWCAGEKQATREIERALRPLGLSLDHATAKAFEERIVEIEKVDLMLVRAEARRDKALQEIAEYRAGFAAQLREAEAAVDADVPALAPPRGDCDG